MKGWGCNVTLIDIINERKASELAASVEAAKELERLSDLRIEDVENALVNLISEIDVSEGPGELKISYADLLESIKAYDYTRTNTAAETDDQHAVSFNLFINKNKDYMDLLFFKSRSGNFINLPDLLPKLNLKYGSEEIDDSYVLYKSHIHILHDIDKPYRYNVPAQDVIGLAVIPTDKKAVLSWTPPVDSTDYRILYDYITPGVIDIQFSGVLNPGGTIVNNLVNGRKYTFRVQSMNNKGEYSPGIDINVTPLDNVAPNEITGIQSIASDGEVTLSWVNPSDSDLASIEITYGIGGMTNQVFGGLKLSSGTVVDGLVNGAAYTFRISTVDTSGNKSAGVLTTARPIDITPPDNVTSLNRLQSDKSITLTWDNNPDIDHVELWYGIGSATTRYMGEISHTGTKILGLSNGVGYVFNVISFDSAGNRSLGISISGTPVDSTAPDEVSNIEVVSLDSSVKISWDNPQGDLDHCELWYGVGSADTKFMGTVTNAGTVITGLTNGLLHVFNIITVDTSNNKSQGTQFTGKPIDQVAPNQVSLISATPADKQVTLSWTDPIDSDFEKVSIFYGVGIANAEYTGPTDSNGTTIAGLVNGSEYIFAVRSVDTSGNSSSAVLIASTPVDITPPAEVNNLELTPTTNSLNVTWDNPSDADFDSVEVWYGIGSANIKFNGVINNNGTLISGLTYNNSYTVKIITVDATGNKSAGAETSVITDTPVYTEDITDVSIETNNGEVTVSYTEPTDPEFDHTEIWVKPVEENN